MPEDHGHRDDPAQGFTMNESIAAPTDDLVARTLATRLRVAAGQVTEPQRSRILNTLQKRCSSHTRPWMTRLSKAPKVMSSRDRDRSGGSAATGSLTRSITADVQVRLTVTRGP